MFQSTPPRGGRRLQSQSLYLSFLFQSTPPRGGRRPRLCRSQRRRCFNPRPRAGGDMVVLVVKAPVKAFQSTPPRGGRPGLSVEANMDAFVSIHAPARGATVDRQHAATNQLFQHIPRWLFLAGIITSSFPPIFQVIIAFTVIANHPGIAGYRGFAEPFTQSTDLPGPNSPWRRHVPPDCANWPRESKTEDCRRPNQPH